MLLPPHFLHPITDNLPNSAESKFSSFQIDPVALLRRVADGEPGGNHETDSRRTWGVATDT